MKHVLVLPLGLALVLALSVPVAAVEAPSLELGQTLFEATDLGSKQRSCATCHPQGKGLEQVGDFNDQELKDIINACIRDALGGTMFAADSQEMDALLAYVRMFQKN